MCDLIYVLSSRYRPVVMRSDTSLLFFVLLFLCPSSYPFFLDIPFCFSASLLGVAFSMSGIWNKQVAVKGLELLLFLFVLAKMKLG